MKMRFLLTALSILVVALASVQAEETIKYIGSSTVGKFVSAAADVYKEASFDINTKPESGGGENATAAGKTDIGGVAREVREKILEKGVVANLIGRDAIGLIVHPSNPVESLTREQLQGIFAGTITNWNEVGGPDLSIDVCCK